MIIKNTFARAESSDASVIKNPITSHFYAIQRSLFMFIIHKIIIFVNATNIKRQAFNLNASIVVINMKFSISTVSVSKTSS